MAAARLHPAAGDRNEVTHVVCDHEPLLLDREREHLLVGEAAERLVLVEREDVVACPGEPSPDVPAGDVRVEQDAQALLVRVGEGEPAEGIELP